MAPHPRIPDQLRRGPFTRDQARVLGLTPRMLNGTRYIRLFPRVWVLSDYPMTGLDWIKAADMAMPGRAQLSHITRIQALGLDFGPAKPFHFTVAGDLHLEVDDLFLHRTEVLPPIDGVGVTPGAAFIQYCADARMIDAIKVGDWLLHRRHMTMHEVAELAHRDRWRPGANKVRRVIPHLAAGSRSLKSRSPERSSSSRLAEARSQQGRTRCRGELIGCGDLVYLLWKLLVEYEGRQHLTDVSQWNRHRSVRRLPRRGWRYVQVTNEKLDTPKKFGQRSSRSFSAGLRRTCPDVWTALALAVRVDRPSGERWVRHPSTRSLGADTLMRALGA